MRGTLLFLFPSLPALVTPVGYEKVCETEEGYEGLERTLCVHLA